MGITLIRLPASHGKTSWVVNQVRSEKAIGVCKEILSRTQDDLDGHIILAYASAAIDRMEDAHQAVKDIIRVKPDFTLEEYAKSQPYRDPRILERIIKLLQIAGLK